MNILTVSHDLASFQFKPDSTLIRTMPDYFIPDYVSELYFSPALCLKSSRAGKAVQPQFTHRYFDSFTFGILLHPTIAETEQDRDISIASAMDFTSLVSNDFLNISQLPQCTFDLTVNGNTRYKEEALPTMDSIRDIIRRITRYTALRTGDFIAIELTPHILTGKEQRIILTAPGLFRLPLTIK